MNRRIVTIAVLIIAFIAIARFAPPARGLAALLFPERVTPEELRAQYAEGKLRVLIVPGHSNDDPGAVYRGVRETDLNIALATRLVEILNEDENIEAYIIRNRNGEYASWFSDYLEKHTDDIKAFRADTGREFDELVAKNGIAFESRVQHNFASNKAGLALHGVNKFANDLDLDIVFHVHFNDYPPRARTRPGMYSGFSIYIPDHRFPNSRSSAVIAESLRDRLARFVPVSNFPGEAGGVVEDHELIAIGSNASRDGASLLVEYGYIYEDPIISTETREAYLRELALQTYLGIVDYLNPAGSPHKTGILPYRFGRGLSQGARGSLDVLALQYALLAEGLYPPVGSSVYACPLAGNYGPCTVRSVKAFQEKYAKEILSPFGLSHGTGVVGPATIKKLNALYAPKYE